MKGNGRIIGFFAAIVLIVVIVVLNFTVFVVRNIEVTATVVSPLIDSERIIDSSNISYNRNILFLNEDEAKRGIEESNPYVEVVSIERRFPWTVDVKVTLRCAVLSIVTDLGQYAILDTQLKILELCDSQTDVYRASVKVKGVMIENPVVGSTLNTDNAVNANLMAVTKAAAARLLDGIAFMTFFKEIQIDASGDFYIATNAGVTLCVFSALDAKKQFICGLELYKYYEPLDERRSSGYYYYDTKLDAEVWSATQPE